MQKFMPTLFISHGSPMMALEHTSTTEFLRSMAQQLPKPRAIIIASAHWETEEPMVTGASKPETIHDFQGFPKELYELHYPAPGDPVLATRIQSLLSNAGFKAGIDSVRGLDHGAWNPLLMMYPDAGIPVIELSVQPSQDAYRHYRVGKALMPLRQENILIIGTGNLTHNLYEAFRGNYSATPLWVAEFAQWVAERVAASDINSLLSWQELAPHAQKNHPTPEHFFPFFVALGAAGTPLHAKRIHADTALGVLAMDAYGFYS